MFKTRNLERLVTFQAPADNNDGEPADENVDEKEDKGTEEFANEFEESLADNPEMLAAYRKHTGGLLRALEAERGNAKGKKELEKQLANFVKQQEEQERQKRTDLENALKDVEALKARAEKAETELKTVKKERIVLDAASALNFIDPNDAVAFLGLSSLDLTEDGKIEGLEGRLKELLKTKPHLQAKKDLGPGNETDVEKKKHLDKDPSARKKYKDLQPKISI